MNSNDKVTLSLAAEVRTKLNFAILIPNFVPYVYQHNYNIIARLHNTIKEGQKSTARHGSAVYIIAECSS